MLGRPVNTRASDENGIRKKRRHLPLTRIRTSSPQIEYEHSIALVRKIQDTFFWQDPLNRWDSASRKMNGTMEYQRTTTQP